MRYRASFCRHSGPYPSARSDAIKWRPVHYRLRKTPSIANRAVGMLSRLFDMAEAWGVAPEGGNPCRFVKKDKNRNCERFLSEQEFRRLGQVLSDLEAEGRVSASVIAAFRLLMLTGCRRNGILTLRWEDVDLDAGEIRLRDAKTGARSVALSPAMSSATRPRLPCAFRIVKQVCRPFLPLTQ